MGTDASDYAVGAVLQQDHGRGLQPAVYLSRKLSSAERNYAVHEKELLAIVHAVRTWRQHLQGVKHTIKVLTDHVTLRYFHRQPKLSQRQMRWTELFQSFDLDIQYKPGRKNAVPDTISRRPDLKTVLCAMLNSQPLPDQDFLHRIRSGYAADPVANHLFQSQHTPSATGANPADRVINNLLFFVRRPRSLPPLHPQFPRPLGSAPPRCPCRSRLRPSRHNLPPAVPPAPSLLATHG